MVKEKKETRRGLHKINPEKNLETIKKLLHEEKVLSKFRSKLDSKAFQNLESIRKNQNKEIAESINKINRWLKWAGVKAPKYHISCRINSYGYNNDVLEKKQTYFNKIIEFPMNRLTNNEQKQLVFHYAYRDRYRENVNEDMDNIEPSIVYFMTNVDKVSIKKIKHKPTKLTEHKMKGASKLKYKFIPHEDKYLKNKDQCVLDALMNEFIKTDRFRYTRPILIEKFNSYYKGTKTNYDCVKDGISVKQIIEFAQEDGRISIWALNGFLQVFEHYIADKQRLSLVFIVNNEHMYLLDDDELKNIVRHKKRLDLNQIRDLELETFDENDIIYHDNKHDTKDIEIALEKSKDKKYILFDQNDISNICQYIMKSSGLIVTKLHRNQSNLDVFEHPETKQLIIASPKWRNRKTTWSKMYEKTNAIDFKVFKNQTWSKISSTWFHNIYGEIPKSTFSPQYFQILKEYPIRPIIQTVNEMKIETAQYRRRNKEGNVLTIELLEQINKKMTTKIQFMIE